MRYHAKTMRCHANHMISASCAPQNALDVYQTLSHLEGGVWERDYKQTSMCMPTTLYQILTSLVLAAM